MRSVSNLWFLVALASAGCAPSYEVGETEQAIVNGEKTDDFPAVGYLFNDSGNILPHCGATLIGEKTVITAAHCVNREHTDLTPNPALARDIGFHLVLHVEDADRFNRYAADSIHIHPDYQGGTKSDLAIVILKEAPPAEIPRMPVAIEQSFRGEYVSLVGYGLDESQNFGRKRRAENRIAGFQFITASEAPAETVPVEEEPPVEGEPPAEDEPPVDDASGADDGSDAATEGEPPADDASDAATEAEPDLGVAMTLWMFGEGNLCNGDSGGAAIVRREGHDVLLGVHTALLGACGQRAFSMMVPTFLDWILETAVGDVHFAPIEEPLDDGSCDRCDGSEGGPQDPEMAGCNTVGISGAGSWAPLFLMLMLLYRRRRAN